MSLKNILCNRRTVLAVIVPGLFIVIPVGYSIVSHIVARGDRSDVFLERPGAKYENCVRETEYMRFHHWELLAQIREDFVRHGKRGDITLSSCRECHPSRERFCNQCHNKVNLTPDCFGCHYYPETPEAALDGANSNRTQPPPVLAGAKPARPPRQ